MAKWEYAAIVADGKVTIGKKTSLKSSSRDVPRFFLVQPGKELHYIVSWERGVSGIREGKIPTVYPWSSPSEFEKESREWEKLFKDSAGMKEAHVQKPKATDASPRILYESSDILHLVNLAGADGWEITGALRLDEAPEHRMMRRQI